MPPYKRTLVIINPKAGSKKTARIRKTIEEHLSEKGLEYDLRETEAAGDALRWSRRARAEGFDLIAVAGGDGTIREAVEGLMRSSSKIPLAQIPTGTGNVTARALSIPLDLRRALDVMTAGTPKSFDIGYLPEHDRYFVFVAGAGYDAKLIHDTTREMKKTLGFFAYVATGIKHFFTVRPVNMELELDDQKMHLKAHTAMGINIGAITKIKFSVAPNIDPHDGRMNVMVLSSRSHWGSLIVLLRVLFKRYYGYSNIKHFVAERVRVSTDPPLPVQIDGEALGSTPFLAEVISNGIQFVVPAEYDSGIFPTL